MRGPRTIALRRGLVTRTRLPISTFSGVTTIATATPSRSTTIPATGVSGKPRWHSTQAGPSSPIPEISQENTYDIVIIGAANAGLALACSLRKLSPWRRGILADEKWTNLVSELVVGSCCWKVGASIKSGHGMERENGRIELVL